jgi:D-alanyl-D-alanine carboxypeptidase/D-alanyl-D-alanine-endopeptidase (penicillin-binding protein 4)
VAGVSGTLDQRMRNTPAKGRVFAKTGFTDGTSALSGLARDVSDNDTVFAILVEYREFGGLNSSVWKPMEDEICELLVGQSL